MQNTASLPPQTPRRTGRKCLSLAAGRVPNLQSGPAGPGSLRPDEGPACRPARPSPPGSPSHDKLDKRSRHYVIVSVSGCEGGWMTSAASCWGRGRLRAARAVTSRRQEKGSSTHSLCSLWDDIPAAGRLETGRGCGAGPEKTAASVWTGAGEAPQLGPDSRLQWSCLGWSLCLPLGPSAVRIHLEPEPECDSKTPLIKNKTAPPLFLTSPHSLSSAQLSFSKERPVLAVSTRDPWIPSCQGSVSLLTFLECSDASGRGDRLSCLKSCPQCPSQPWPGHPPSSLFLLCPLPVPLLPSPRSVRLTPVPCPSSVLSSLRAISSGNYICPVASVYTLGQTGPNQAWPRPFL